MGSRERQNTIAGLIFTSPFIVGFLIFTLYPIAASLFYSFTSYRILTPPHWIGLGNYQRMLFKDELFWTSLYNSGFFTLLSVPSGLLASFVLALALNANIRGLSIYRTVFYLPSLVPTVAVAIIWLWLFHTRYGLLNIILQWLGLPRVGWLTSPGMAKPSLAIMGLWLIGPTIIIFLAALQDVPQHLYESAEIDGAYYLQKTIYITIPMVTPVILFNLIMGLIGSFQYFTQVYIMTDGGPVHATLMYVMYLYKNGFEYVQMGYASALAWVLFLVILLCTVLVLRSSGRWVYYGGMAR